MAWLTLEKVYFLIVGTFVLVGVIAVLFIRPYGQTLPVFLKNFFFFAFKPRVYIWKRGYQNLSNDKKIEKPVIQKEKPKKKKASPQEIKKAIESLDIYE